MTKVLLYPTIEYTNGNKIWLFNGKLHRVTKCIFCGQNLGAHNPTNYHLKCFHIDKDGSKFYYLPDKKTLHRVDGPAVELSNGYKQWSFNGKLHRVDGPAIEYADGDKRYFLNGTEYSFKIWNKLRKMLWIL